MRDTSRAPTVRGRLVRLTRVFFPSVALGVGNEILIVLIGAVVPGVATVPVANDLSSRLSWSVVVCGGLGLGFAAGRGRLGAIALAGLLSAPIAFDLARAFRKGTVGYLQLIETSGLPSPILVATVKGIEYGCLGLALGWIARRRRWGAIGHATAGLVTGVVFGGALLALNVQAGIVGTGPFLTWLVNELLFPIGCALVVYQSGLTDPAESKES